MSGKTSFTTLQLPRTSPRVRRAILTLAAILLCGYTAVSLPQQLIVPIWLPWTRLTRPFTGVAAPMSDCSSSPFEDRFVVKLAHGYSVDRHERFIGRADLKDAITRVSRTHWNHLWGSDGEYFLHSADASLISAIRSDYGVLFITCRSDKEPAVMPDRRVVTLRPELRPRKTAI